MALIRHIFLLSAINNNMDAIIKYGDVSNFPNATPLARKNIIDNIAKKINDEKFQQIKTEQEQVKIERAKAQELEQNKTDNYLKNNGYEGYYEYRILNIHDEKSGAVNIEHMLNELNSLGRQGWQIKCAFTNELGKNSMSAGLGGFSLGTNSTVDQSILILERFVKFNH